MIDKKSVARHTKIDMKKRGFTLIEILITVSIVALLSGLVMINIIGNLAKARDSKRKNDLRELKTSLDLYYNINNMYPPSASSGWPPSFDGNETITGCGVLTTPTACAWGSAWSQGGVVYMSPLPKDPTGTQAYFYRRASSGRLTYLLVAKMERSFDPDITRSQEICADPTVYQFQPGWYIVCDVK